VLVTPFKPTHISLVGLLNMALELRQVR